MQGKQVQRLLFLALFLFLLIFVARLFSPFFSILLWAGLLYVIVFPLYERVTRAKSPKPMNSVCRKLTAAAFSVFTVLLVVVPLVFLGSALVGQIRELVHAISSFLENHPDFFRSLDDGGLALRIRDMSGGLIDLTQIDLVRQLADTINAGASRFLSISATLLRDTVSFVVSLAFLVFTLFFFFVDGKDLILTFINVIPIEKSYTAAFLQVFRDVTRNLFRGYLLVALYQGTAAFLIFFCFGVKGPLPLGLFTAIASFIPMVGTTLVWGPVGIAQIVSGNVTGGIAMLILCFTLVSGVDNLLRPLLIKGGIKMHPLLLFFSIMGGLKLFGMNGLILGPMLLMLFFTGVELFNQAYGEKNSNRKAKGEPREKPAGAGDTAPRIEDAPAQDEKPDNGNP
jgi:predicted PurR-regulated permease PerM